MFVGRPTKKCALLTLLNVHLEEKKEEKRKNSQLVKNARTAGNT